MATGRPPSKRVTLQSLGENRGGTVNIPKGMLAEMGLDPNAEIEVHRQTFDTDRAEMRLRFYEVNDD